MNKKLYLSMMAFALALAACSGKKEAVRTTGIKISNLDTTALPVRISISMHVGAG